MLKKFRKKLLRQVVRDVLDRLPDNNGLEIYIAALLRDISRDQPLNDPDAGLGLLRESLAPDRFDVVEVKHVGGTETLRERRFAQVVEAVGSLPPVPEATACRCARIADTYLGSTEEYPEWDADVAWHFAKASCNMRKGRVMTAIVRFMRPVRCLEIGTAFGFSASVIASALERFSPHGRLLTIELSQVRHRLASALLANLFQERVTCRRGDKAAVLAPAAREMAPVDFVFHDGGHSGDDYVRDFGTILEALAPGGVVLFDDIRWRNPRQPEVDPRCHEGWCGVVDHPRVERAVEVGPNLGLLMVS